MLGRRSSWPRLRRSAATVRDGDPTDDFGGTQLMVLPPLSPFACLAGDDPGRCRRRLPGIVLLLVVVAGEVPGRREGDEPGRLNGDPRVLRRGRVERASRSCFALLLNLLFRDDTRRFI